MKPLKHGNITDKIIKAFFRVYNTLGYGFLEKVYENALVLELQQMSLQVSQQKPIKVYYNRQQVGDYYADIVVENAVIIELKVADKLCDAHETQLLNYLKATEIEVGLLLNFGPSPQFKRTIFDNDNKQLKDINLF